MKSIITFTVAVIICFIANSQTTEAFKKIDAGYSFKGIMFGTRLSLLSTKMKLEKGHYLNEYIIKNEKYLSIGKYNSVYGLAYFSENKLYSIQQFINVPDETAFQNVLEYFSDLFGTPTYLNGYYYWTGDKILYSLKYSKSTDDALVTIKSRLIKDDLGGKNF